MSNFKKYSDKTLLNMTKKDLLEQLRTAEYNREVAEQSLDLQAKILKDWRPPKHGKWEYEFNVEDKTSLFKCSACGMFVVTNTKYLYCPNCGAKMDLGGKK